MSLLLLAKKLRAEIEGAPTVRIDYEWIYLALTVDAGTAEDLSALGRHVELNGAWVAQEVSWLDRRCDRLARARADDPTYRAAVLLLVARIDELRRWEDSTRLASGPRQLNLLVNQPVLGPVSLPDGTEITNVGRFLGRLLTAVNYVLACPAVAGADALLNVYLEQLAALGIEGKVKVAQ